MIGALGYVLAGVIGRVFAEVVLDAFWPAAGALRTLTAPLTVGRPGDRGPRARAHRRRPTRRPGRRASRWRSPPTAITPRTCEADLPESTRELLQHAVELTRCDVSEIMTPRSAIVALPGDGLRPSGRADLPRDGQEPHPALRREPRRHHRHPLRQGPLPPDDRRRAPRRGDAPQAGPAGVLRPRDQERLRAARRVPRRVGRRSPSCSTSTAASPGWSRSKTCSRSWSARSTTSTTSRRPTDPVVPLGGTRYEVDATLSIEELNERLRPAPADRRRLPDRRRPGLPRPGPAARARGLVPVRGGRVHRRRGRRPLDPPRPNRPATGRHGRQPVGRGARGRDRGPIVVTPSSR